MHRRHLLRRGVTTTLLALIVLPLSGCYEADVDASIDHDTETISATILVGAQTKYAESVMGVKSAKDFNKAIDIKTMLAPVMPKDATFAPWEADDAVGTKITFTDLPLDKMPLEMPGITLDVTHEKDTYVLDATIDPQASAVPTTFLEPSHTSVSVTFPGDITETNGKADGSTVTWEHSGADALEMTATSTEQPSLVSAAKQNLWAPALGLVALLALGAAGFALRRDMKRKKAAMPKAAGKKGQRGTTDTYVPPPKFATPKTTNTPGTTKTKDA